MHAPQISESFVSNSLPLLKGLGPLQGGENSLSWKATKKKRSKGHDETSVYGEQTWAGSDRQLFRNLFHARFNQIHLRTNSCTRA